MRKAIYTKINGRKTFIGKHIDDKIVREFEFNTAVLWQDKTLSFDKRLLDYAKGNEIKAIVFSDPKKMVRLEIGLDDVLKVGRAEEYGEEVQWYIPMSSASETPYYKTAYISEEIAL